MKFKKHVKHKAVFKVSTSFVISSDGQDNKIKVVIPNYLIKYSACKILTNRLSVGRIVLLEGNTEISYRPELGSNESSVSITYPGASIYWTKIKPEYVGIRIAADMCRIMRKYAKPKSRLDQLECLWYI